MTFPKWRHHPTHESVIVYTPDQEESQTPDGAGWRDDRLFEPLIVIKNKGGRPRKDTA